MCGSDDAIAVLLLDACLSALAGFGKSSCVCDMEVIGGNGK